MIATLDGATKIYKTGDQKITALKSTSLEINKGELTLILGPSGSGKTTLISLIGAVIHPSEGEVILDGHRLSELKSKKLAWLRLHYVGFVFQEFNLIQPLTAEQNILFPLKLLKVPQKEAMRKVEEALEMVNMTDRRKNLPRQLSGGQQQRIAIARALVTDPPIILCDEPTASLDSKALEMIMNQLKELSEMDKAVVIVTHDPRLKPYSDRIIEMEDGGVVNEIRK
jgi:putative ABC transport system ATP-binding protein